MGGFIIVLPSNVAIARTTSLWYSAVNFLLACVSNISNMIEYARALTGGGPYFACFIIQEVKNERGGIRNSGLKKFRAWYKFYIRTKKRQIQRCHKKENAYEEVTTRDETIHRALLRRCMPNVAN